MKLIQIVIKILTAPIRLFINTVSAIKVVTDKNPLTFDEELRRNRLKPGAYAVTGPQRSGKSSWCVAAMDIDCRHHCEERLELAEDIIDNLNSLNQKDSYNLHLPDFPYRSNYEAILGPDDTPTYHTDIPQFALPANQKNVQYFPPYTVVFADEPDSHLNCRSWEKNKEEKAHIVDAFKLVGHNFITWLGAVQVLSRLDAAIRTLITDNIFIIKKKDYYAEDNNKKSIWNLKDERTKTVIKTEWTFLWIKHQIKEQAKELNSFGLNNLAEYIKVEDYVKKCTLVYYGNIYDHYNSESGQPYWFNNIEDYKVERHPSQSMTKEAVKDFCKRNTRSACTEENPEQDKTA